MDIIIKVIQNLLFLNMYFDNICSGKYTPLQINSTTKNSKKTEAEEKNMLHKQKK